MASLFACVAIFSCKSIGSGVDGEFLGGYCIPCNCRGIIRANGFVLGCWGAL